MVQYDLSHLTQDSKQEVCGPIQDDEALFLFALIRCKLISRILEIGGLSGYSAKNFLEAIKDKPNGKVYTVDINHVDSQSANHKCIIKDACQLTPDDVDNLPLDLVFFDCHELDVQLTMFNRLREAGLITPKTILILHDTNLHSENYMGFSYHIDEGWVHQPVERRMTNFFKDMGYDVFCLHTSHNDHDENLPYRHGLTICQRFDKLKT